MPIYRNLDRSTFYDTDDTGLVVLRAHGDEGRHLIYSTRGTLPDMWSGTDDEVREVAHHLLRMIGDMDLLPEPSPVGERRRSPSGDAEVIRIDNEGGLPWFAYKWQGLRRFHTDEQVADWEVISDPVKAPDDV